MIKVKWMNSEAFVNPAGSWQSDNKEFENSLNIRAGGQLLEGYHPDYEDSLLNLAIETFPGLEVLEKKLRKQGKIPKGAVY